MPKSKRSKTQTTEAPARRFIVWAQVSHAEHEVVMPATATDEECEAACKDVLDVLIGNGDTGWNELTEE